MKVLKYVWPMMSMIATLFGMGWVIGVVGTHPWWSAPLFMSVALVGGVASVALGMRAMK